MRITDQQLDVFIQIYQKNFGVMLDRESAYTKGIKLVEVLGLILKDGKITKDKINMTKI